MQEKELEAVISGLEQEVRELRQREEKQMVGGAYPSGTLVTSWYRSHIQVNTSQTNGPLGGRKPRTVFPTV